MVSLYGLESVGFRVAVKSLNPEPRTLIQGPTQEQYHLRSVSGTPYHIIIRATLNHDIGHHVTPYGTLNPKS